MIKETITQKQGITLVTLFLIGTTLITGTAAKAERDIWIALLLGYIAAVPLFFVYYKLLDLAPGKNIFEILDISFGKVLGRIIALPLIWFSFHLGAMVSRNFSELLYITSLHETPQFFVNFVTIVIAIMAVRSGLEVIGRFSIIILPLVIIGSIVITLLFIPNINFENLKPICYKGIRPIINGAFTTLLYPFGEAVLFTAVLNNLRKKDSPYKTYLISLLVSSIIILLVGLRSLLVLGIDNLALLYLDTFISAKLINIGDFIQRIEIAVTFSFVLSSIVKHFICLYVTSLGVAHIFNIKDYRQVVAPIGLLNMILTIILYECTIEMFTWITEYYTFYAYPFTLVLPILILIIGSIRKKFGKNKTINNSNNEIMDNSIVTKKE